MTLKELQEMIKEEFNTFVKEADDVDVDVDTDAGDMDTPPEMGDEGSEEMLRNIYDMLKAKFEGGEEPIEEPAEEPEDEEMEEDMMGEAPKDDEDTMEEASAQGFGDSGNKKTSGANVGYTPAKTTRGDGKLHEGKSPLQKRFQKLANIIK